MYINEITEILEKEFEEIDDELENILDGVYRLNDGESYTVDKVADMIHELSMRLNSNMGR